MTESEAEEAAEVLLEESAGGSSAVGEPPQAEEEEGVDYLYLDGVARCMADKGFDFVPYDDQPAPHVDGSPYGITASLVAEPAVNPNEELLSTLPPEAEKVYLTALWGDPSDDAVVGCADTAFEDLVDPTLFETEGDADVFADRRVEELRLRAEANAIARGDVLEAVSTAERCVLERLGDDLSSSPFDFVSHAERRVAAILDPKAAAEGATASDIVEGGDVPLSIDESTIESMLAAERLVWETEQECRAAIQETLDEAFVEEATELLAESPDLAVALLEVNRLRQ